MGELYYGSSTEPIRIPDRLLAHVKVVAATKLRRGEAFTLTWRHQADEPRGRSTIWLQPSIPLRFVFGSAEAEKLDAELLRSLADQSNASSGVVLDLEAEHDDNAAATLPLHTAA
jgi:integrase